MTNQEKVLAFMRKHEQYIQEKPAIPNDDILKFRVKLVTEEAKELIDASEDRDLIEIADALADLMYVIYGYAIAFGIDLDSIFNEVHESNMSKEIAQKRKDGKVLKTEEFKGPRIKEILEMQGLRDNVLQK